MSEDEKKYKIPDSESQLLSESAIAYRKDVNTRKLRIMEGIMHIDNSDHLEQLEEFIDNLSVASAKPPCQYTIAELRERIIQGEKDIAAGNVYDAEEIMKDWDEWVKE